MYVGLFGGISLVLLVYWWVGELVGFGVFCVWFWCCTCWLIWLVVLWSFGV